MAKVLIVDDEFGSRDSSQALLEVEGFEVEVAASGREALELQQRFQPDVLVVDRILGGEIDGMEVVKLSRDVDPKLPVVVITGYVSAELEAQIESMPLVQCMLKPIPPEEFIEAVRKASQHRAVQ